MKTIYSLALAVMCLALATACGTTSQMQENNTTVENAVLSKNYIFTAQSVTPLGGRYRQLTSDYDLRVLGDSVVAYLPYFGRAYSAPIDPTNGGINFTSTNFDYEQGVRTKGGWIVTIRPHDARDVRELTLTIATGGNATLQVISNNRQSISFSGYVHSRK